MWKASLSALSLIDRIGAARLMILHSSRLALSSESRVFRVWKFFG